MTASQKNWLDLLDVAQFCYNVHRSSATGMSPAELAMGQQPNTPHEVAKQRRNDSCPAAYRFAHNKQDLMMEARDSLAKASKSMKKYADQHRRSVEFQVGDLVMLKLTPQIWKKLRNRAIHKGLVRKYEGPYEVLKKVGSVAYRLKLPDSYKIHPTFHVSFLKAYIADADDQGRQKARRAPAVVRTQFDKELEKILDHRTLGQSKKNRRTDFLVQWKGQSEADASWERDVTLWKFEDMIADYLKLHTTRTSSSSSGGGLLHP